MFRALGSTTLHQAMNDRMRAMLGEQGETRMHQLLGARYAGCSTRTGGIAGGAGMMGGSGMMGGYYSNGGIGAMMRSSDWNWMMGGAWQHMTRKDWQRRQQQLLGPVAGTNRPTVGARSPSSPSASEPSSSSPSRSSRSSAAHSDGRRPPRPRPRALDRDPRRPDPLGQRRADHPRGRRARPGCCAPPYGLRFTTRPPSGQRTRETRPDDSHLSLRCGCRTSALNRCRRQRACKPSGLADAPSLRSGSGPPDVRNGGTCPTPTQAAPDPEPPYSGAPNIRTVPVTATWSRRLITPTVTEIRRNGSPSASGSSSLATRARRTARSVRPARQRRRPLSEDDG